MINLDEQREQRAARREGGLESVPVHFRGVDYHLPAELPAVVLDPLLNGQVDLTELVRVASMVAQDSEQRDSDAIFAALLARPDLPAGVLQAIYDFIRALFGVCWDEFWAAKPSVPDIAALMGGLFRIYGVGLGELFGSTGSSPDDGPTVNQTSNGSTASTPAESGAPLAIPIS